MNIITRRGPAFTYIIYAAATFIVLCLTITMLLFSLQYKGIITATSESAKWIYTIDGVQKNACENNPSPAIRIIGGSASLYSVSTYELGRNFRLPVTNLALHAGLGLDYLLYRAKKYLQPNDVAVLLLEPGMFKSIEQSWTAADWVIPQDYTYLGTLNLQKTSELLAKLTLEEYQKRIISAFYSQPRPLAFSTLNQSGDLIANLSSRRTAVTAVRLMGWATKPFSFDFHPNAIQILKDFILWCRERNILVVGGYAPFLTHPAYFTLEGSRQLDAWEHMWEESGVLTIKNPRDFIFSSDLFFDTIHHMDSAGRRVMTACLAGALKKLLPPEMVKQPEASPITIYLDNPYPYPDGFIDLSGISTPEDWGAWTDGPVLRMEFAGSYNQPFWLKLSVTHVFAENLKSPLRIRAGGAEREINITASGEYSILLEPKEPTSVLSIELPAATTPEELGKSTDTRKLGLGLKSITIVPLGP